MKNIFSAQINTKRASADSLLKEIQSNTQDVKLKERNTMLSALLNEGKVYYLPENFDAKAFHEALRNWMLDDMSFEIESADNREVRTYRYQATKGLKVTIGLRSIFQLVIASFENQLIYFIKPDDWLTVGEKKESTLQQLGKKLHETYEADIEKFIETHILKTREVNTYIIQTNNYYVENISDREKIWFYCAQQQGEMLLSLLDVSQMKKFPTQEEAVKKQLTWRYVLTSQSSAIVAVNSKFEVEYFEDLSGKPMKVIKEMGRNPVQVAACEWLSKLNNDTLYEDIGLLPEATSGARIREIARLNWKNKSKNVENKHLSLFLLDDLLKKEYNPFDQFTRLFIEYFDVENESILSTFSNEKLTDLLKIILTQDQSEANLANWFEAWDISHLNAAVLIQIFLNVANTTTLMEKILPIHKKVREIFTRDSKDKVDSIVFEIDYCRHLLACYQKDEACQVLEGLLKQLPDESFSDVMPSNEIPPTSTSTGQVLRVTILDLLAEAKGITTASLYIQQAAQLQPLVKQRMYQLHAIATNELKNRAGEIVKLIEPEGLTVSDEIIASKKLNPLNDKLVDSYLKHPAGRKDKMVDSLQKWVASVKVPDYSVLKSYSEKLSSTKYPEVYAIIEEFKVTLNLPKIEVYISRGEKSVGIRSYEADPQFLIVGGDHLDKTSPSYLNTSELKFAIGSELAMLYFKFARITSNDVWRGAIEKSNFVLDTMLTIIPLVGFFGKMFGVLSKLNTVSHIARGAEKVTKITSQGKNVVFATEQANEVYKKVAKKDEKTEKEQELLAASRLVQLTADRTGLILCNNVNAAIRAMFILSKKHFDSLPSANRMGLSEFLNIKNADNTNQNQDLAVRISNLLSFYISDDYQMLQKSL